MDVGLLCGPGAPPPSDWLAATRAGCRAALGGALLDAARSFRAPSTTEV